MDRLQSEKEASKHYASNYSGKNGAVAYSRAQIIQAFNLLREPVIFGLDEQVVHELRMAQVRQMLVSHISTLCSAIKPVAMKMRFAEAFGLVKECRLVLSRLKGMGYSGLSLTEMEVTVAALLKVWPVGRPVWATRDALLLSEKILVGSMYRVLTSTDLLTMARIASIHHADADDYWKACNMAEQVRASVKNVCVFGLSGGLNEWSTVARCASLIGMKKEMHYAAVNDGTPDVLIKYGPFFEKVKAIWKTKDT